MAERILNSLVHEQYLEDLALYTIATNLVRALPDIRDGFKPSSRRILYDLLIKKAIGYNNKIKSAAINGSVMELFHPHGDTYPTFKTMINWYEAKMPMIGKQGSFGTINGEGPSAMRYTELFLNDFGRDCVIGSLMNSNEVVDWNPNYSNTDFEPQYLPVKVPLLLINGILGGIGTGVKTDLPSHCISEVIAATLRVIDDPNAPVVLVPDHCIGCDIIDTDWESISNTGSGSYRARATIETSYDKHDQPILTITSLPTFGTNAVCQAIDNGIASGKFPQIDVRKTSHGVDPGYYDESQDSVGVKIVIRLKKGSDVNFVKEALYKYTPCEQSFRVNFEVVLGTELKHLSYKQYIEAFIVFAVNNKIREYSSRHYVVSTRLHKLDAFIKITGSEDIDNIIKMIQKRKESADNELIEFLIKKYHLTNIQAEYIINAQIKSLSKGNYLRYVEEFKKLSAEEKWLEDRMINEDLVKADVRQELVDINKKYGRPRICRVIKVSNLGNIPEGNFKIVITENNYIRKLTETDTVSPIKGDKPKFIMTVSNLESILLFDNKGKVFKLPIHKIPIIAKTDPGIDIKGVIKGLTADIISVIYEPTIKSLDKLPESKRVYLAVLSKNNTLKKLDINDFLNVSLSGLTYSKISPDDDIVSVQLISNNLDVIIYSDTKAIRISAMDIPWYKRNTLGVAAMNTKSPIEGMSVVYPNATSIVVITRSGKINKISVTAVERSQRNKAGHNVIKLGATDSIHSIYGVNDANTIVVNTMNEVLTIPVNNIPMGSSISTGVKVVPTKSDIIIKTNII